MDLSKRTSDSESRKLEDKEMKDGGSVTINEFLEINFRATYDP